ncbi:hypothetical protein DM469_03085 [Lactobacillus helveticus]|uniref:Transposase n=1 Tax=Lactobacillus helveticus TaxID=1587 RepID=A0AAU8XWZ2_LACHE|nr:hypothetical protein Lh8105_11125 [Lactobacillus helveticus]MCS8612362.1 hypothetical protein [Lactobacillus helveticus]MCT3411129.1 hypothetical protein [Lactobacillus helveticus]MCT3432462.1 hypothetical protein [Lactobacillus helveticus]MCT3434168.1 hypothetical protein [Lactobacillus helveticus]
MFLKMEKAILMFLKVKNKNRQDVQIHLPIWYYYFCKRKQKKLVSDWNPVHELLMVFSNIYKYYTRSNTIINN